MSQLLYTTKKKNLANRVNFFYLQLKSASLQFKKLKKESKYYISKCYTNNKKTYNPNKCLKKKPKN